MIVFKPRLTLFYIIALVIISFATNRLTISSQSALAEIPKTIANKTNVESCHP